MSEFLLRSACRGRRPLQGSSSRHVPRPALIARLLRERHVARFIVAPDGYGKTQLALEYADTVFSFEHVFWVDGASPCFLRDVDEGCVARVLLAAEREPFLVVFEDLPPLDPARAEGLSHEMDALLDRDCEVLATCVPSCDAFERHRDRIKLSASDLLLSDEELDALRLPSARAAKPAAQVPAASRAAGLVWGPEDGSAPRVFLEAALSEELPGDLLLAIFVMLALGEGELSELSAFGPCDADQAALLAERCPHLGIDLQGGRFKTAPFSVDELAAGFAEKLELAVARSLQGGRDAFVLALADALASRRAFGRACDLVRLLAGRPARAEWLADRGGELVEGLCLLPASELYRSLVGEKAGRIFRLAADEALRRALLGDDQGACSCAERVCGSEAAPLRDRALSALVLARAGDVPARRRAEELLGELAAAGEGVLARGEPASGDGDDGALEWICALRVQEALLRSPGKAARVWSVWRQRGAQGPGLAFSASWLLQAAVLEDAAASRGAAALERMGGQLRELVCEAQGDMGLSWALAGVAYEKACESGRWNLGGLDAAASVEARRLEAALYSQREACERLERDRADERRLFSATHPDLVQSPLRSRASEAPVQVAPLLTVNLFGGLEVFVGDEPVPASRFRRRKTQTLLALLTLNRGHELQRSQLAEQLWPDSDPDKARNNFYGVWSELRRALTTPAGDCPYLIRRQQGVRLDPKLLRSDVQEMDEVCRALLFEKPGYGGWAQVYEKVDRKFSEELVPGEDDNEAIAGIRIDYRNRLVDALLAASRRLVAAGDVQEGLWFARAALARDRTREDAYDALMRAQVASGQRAAALDTYFSCRRFLAEELGIDPAVETVELYRDIIETEESLV